MPSFRALKTTELHPLYDVKRKRFVHLPFSYFWKREQEVRDGYEDPMILTLGAALILYWKSRSWYAKMRVCHHPYCLRKSTSPSKEGMRLCDYHQQKRDFGLICFTDYCFNPKDREEGMYCGSCNEINNRYADV